MWTSFSKLPQHAWRWIPFIDSFLLLGTVFGLLHALTSSAHVAAVVNTQLMLSTVAADRDDVVMSILQMSKLDASLPAVPPRHMAA